MLFFISQSSAAGATILAVNVILLQFVNWMSYGIDGFAFATESLVGKYKGAENQEKLHLAIKLNFLIAMILALAYSLAYWVFGDQFILLFTDDQSLADASQPFLFWMCLFPLLSTPCYIWDGVYIGLTAAKPMRDTMIASLILYLLLVYLLHGSHGNHGLWFSLLMFMVFRALMQWVVYKRDNLDKIPKN